MEHSAIPNVFIYPLYIYIYIYRISEVHSRTQPTIYLPLLYREINWDSSFSKVYTQGVGFPLPSLRNTPNLEQGRRERELVGGETLHLLESSNPTIEKNTLHLPLLGGYEDSKRVTVEMWWSFDQSPSINHVDYSLMGIKGFPNYKGFAVKAEPQETTLTFYPILFPYTTSDLFDIDKPNYDTADTKDGGKFCIENAIADYSTGTWHHLSVGIDLTGTAPPAQFIIDDNVRIMNAASATTLLAADINGIITISVY